MSDTFSSKSFMSRYFSGGPVKTSGGPAKTSDGPAKPKLKRKEDKLKKTAKQLADPDVAGKKWSRKLVKYRKTKEQIKEIESKSDGPTKRTRAERQSDRDDKKTTRRAKRADKRIKRNKDKVTKLEGRIKEGKERYNVDDAGNKTTGRKANRIARAKKKVEVNEKISKKGKDLKKKKGEEKARKVTQQVKDKKKEDSKVIMNKVNAAFDKNKKDKKNKTAAKWTETIEKMPSS